MKKFDRYVLARQREDAGVKARRMFDAARSAHKVAWSGYMKALTANRAALRKGRVPYRVAQALIDRSEAVGRCQDRLYALESRYPALLVDRKDWG